MNDHSDTIAISNSRRLLIFSTVRLVALDFLFSGMIFLEGIFTFSCICATWSNKSILSLWVPEPNHYVPIERPDPSEAKATRSQESQVYVCIKHPHTFCYRVAHKEVCSSRQGVNWGCIHLGDIGILLVCPRVHYIQRNDGHVMLVSPTRLRDKEEDHVLTYLPLSARRLVFTADVSLSAPSG